MSAPPRVTVVCPVHNRSTALVGTVESVLAQDLQDFELILVLDGCTDDTAAVAARYRTDPRVRVLTTPAHGHPARPRSIGARAATAPSIAYLDHDDVWERAHLAELVALLDTGAPWAATGAWRRGPDGTDLGRSTPLSVLWHPDLQRLTPLFEPSRVGHRTDLLDVADWVPGPGLEDWDLWRRWTDAGLVPATSAAVTAGITEHPGTRRTLTRRTQRWPLAHFADVGRARAALEQIRSRETAALLATAARDDLVSWVQRSVHAPATVRPRGVSARTLVELAEAVDPAADVDGWVGEFCLGPARGGGAVLSLVTWCASTEGLWAMAEAAVRLQPRQWAAVHRVVREHGGTLHPVEYPGVA